MAIELFANQPQTTVTAGGSTAPSGGTTETWTVASSAEFPSAASGTSQFRVVDSATGKTGEIILVTNVSGTTWTVTRGAESTTPVTHSSGFTVFQDITAGVLAAFLQSGKNLSDLGSASTARTNLGLGTAATQASGAFDASGAAAAAQSAAEAASLPLSGGTMTGAIAMGSHKVTGLTNGSSAQDAAAFGQIPTSLPPAGTAASAVAPVVVALTFATTVTVNAALGNAFSLTLTASTATLGAPSSPVDGQVIRFRITQGTGGSFTLAYNSAYDFGTAGTPTLSTAAAKVDVLGFEYVASISKWCYVGSGLGF